MTATTPPPELPPSPATADVAPPRRPDSGWTTARTVVRALVTTALAVAGVAVVGVVILAYFVLHGTQERHQRSDCWEHLHALGEIYLREGRSQSRSGPGLFLEWRKRRTTIKEGQEQILICPCDPAAIDRYGPEFPPESGDKYYARWDDADLDAPAPGLCSYAVRDFAAFPLAPDGTTPQPLAACLHHDGSLFRDGCVLVLFDDGVVSTLSAQDLGVSDESDFVVGPQSKAALLRPLTFGKGR